MLHREMDESGSPLRKVGVVHIKEYNRSLKKSWFEKRKESNCPSYGGNATKKLKIFKKLVDDDFIVLNAIERGMKRYEYVPIDVLSDLSGLSQDEVIYRLSSLNKFELIVRWKMTYTGYILNHHGYDMLALNALVKGDILEAFGKPLGIGKEADVFDALTPNGKRVAVKIHRLGRISFRQTQRTRSYHHPDKKRLSWLYESRLAAEREYEALTRLHPAGISVPRPIAQNRHIVVMSMIEGDELSVVSFLPTIGWLRKKDIAEQSYKKVIKNVKEAYKKVGIIHGDLSEFNIIITHDFDILIIDWPQWVSKTHPNASLYLKRDLENVIRNFHKKFGMFREVDEELERVLSEI